MSAVEEHKPVEKRRALGRGLDSLLPSGPRMVPAAPTSAAGAATARTGMSEPHGAAAVRPPVIPAAVAAIVRQLGNEQAAEMTIVENLQRQDLNCLEQAQAFARLSQEFNLTQEQIGKRTGTSRESVANYMRLLKLPKAVLDLVGEGKLGFSEARVLLEATPYLEPAGIEEMAQNAIRLDWTVKDLKAQVNLLQNPARYEAQPKDEKAVDPNVRDAERRLRESLGMRVRVMAYQGNKGQIVIRYESLADFDRVLERLAGDN